MEIMGKHLLGCKHRRNVWLLAPAVCITCVGTGILYKGREGRWECSVMHNRTQASLNDLIPLTLKRKFRDIANPLSVETIIPKYQALILDIQCQLEGY